MKRQSCRVCGEAIDRGATSCPHCGARLRPGISRVWVLAFFVMGVVIGLMLLILQGSMPLSWPALTSTPPPAKELAPQGPPANLSAGRIRGDKVDGKQSRTRPEPITVEPIDCDRDAAQAVRDKARSLAVISEQAGALQLQMGDDWLYYSPGHRRSFVEVFSKADRCLQGHGRTIRFRFRGDEVATVSAVGAVEMK